MMDEATRRQIEFTAAWHQRDSAYWSAQADLEREQGRCFFAAHYQRLAARAAQHAMMDLLTLIDGRTW